jgi:hypothetical protein
VTAAIAAWSASLITLPGAHIPMRFSYAALYT